MKLTKSQKIMLIQYFSAHKEEHFLYLTTDGVIYSSNEFAYALDKSPSDDIILITRSDLQIHLSTGRLFA